MCLGRNTNERGYTKVEEEIMYRISKQAGLSLLRSIYDIINQQLFNAELPKIPIKIQKMDKLESAFPYQPGAAFCVDKERICYCTIKDGEIRDRAYDLERISLLVDRSVLYFSNPTEFFARFVGYILHEMVHEYCYMMGIDDCNHTTQYHNSQFLIVAESHGLTCDYDKECGFNQTSVQSKVFFNIIDQIPEDVMKQVCDNIVAFYSKPLMAAA